MNKVFLRLVSVYLWWFVIVFILATSFIQLSFLAEGTFWGDILIRRPYQWDFELMFTVLFLIWGVFFWKASSQIEQSQTFLRFSTWAFISHAVVFVIIGLINREDIIHALTDATGWAIVGVITLKSTK